MIEKLIGPRLLVKPEWTKDETDGGLIIPDAFKEKTQEALVLKVGRGHVLKDGRIISVCAQPGDRILYGKLAGTEIEIKGERLLIIRDTDIVAVIKTNKKGGKDGSEKR